MRTLIEILAILAILAPTPTSSTWPAPTRWWSQSNSRPAIERPSIPPKERRVLHRRTTVPHLSTRHHVLTHWPHSYTHERMRISRRRSGTCSARKRRLSRAIARVAEQSSGASSQMAIQTSRNRVLLQASLC
jgi:hypothetical protein